MIRYATIGTGWIVDAFIEGTSQVDGLSHAGVYSRDEERGSAFAKKHGITQTFTDLEKLACDPQIDAVYIASPNHLHVSQSLLMLKHGKHVLCEKPVAACRRDAEMLIQTAAKNQVIFMEAIVPLHLPRMRTLEDAVRSIGPISLARLDFSQYSSKYPAYLAGELPNIFNPAFHTGALMDLGVYCVYMAIQLFGRPSHILASASLLPSGADASGSAIFEYPRMQAVLTYSKTGNARRGSELIGQKGTLILDSISGLESMRTVDLKGDVHTLFGLEDKNIRMSYEAQDFVECINNASTDTSHYVQWGRLCSDVCGTMEYMRSMTGIHFPDDRN